MRKRRPARRLFLKLDFALPEARNRPPEGARVHKVGFVCGEVVHAITQSVPVGGGRDRLALSGDFHEPTNTG